MNHACDNVCENVHEPGLLCRRSIAPQKTNEDKCRIDPDGKVSQQCYLCHIAFRQLLFRLTSHIESSRVRSLCGLTLDRQKFAGHETCQICRWETLKMKNSRHRKAPDERSPCQASQGSDIQLDSSVFVPNFSRESIGPTVYLVLCYH